MSEPNNQSSPPGGGPGYIPGGRLSPGEAARQMKREETIYRHRERVTRAALITGSTVL